MEDEKVVHIDGSTGEVFRTYDSWEQMFDAIRESEARANATLTPAQKAVVYGSYWVTLYPDYGDLWVFGYVLTEEESYRSEIEAGADPEEARYTAERLRDSYARGYRFGKAYSVITPEGEYGSTHVASIAMPITKEQFEQARRDGWRPPQG